MRPCDAATDKLPSGFPYETDQEWLEAIEFGKQYQQKTVEDVEVEKREKEKDQFVKDLGFNSVKEAGTMADIASVLKAQGKSPEEFKAELIARNRRRERIFIEIENAPEKEYEARERSVRTTRGTIDPRIHLREKYENDSKEMKCQCCKENMPFNGRDGLPYFEAVEALGNEYFIVEHESQYLALCPECAAKYKEFVKRDKDTQTKLYNLLKNSEESEVLLELDGIDIKIWFEEKHWLDLKTVIDYYEDSNGVEVTT